LTPSQRIIVIGASAGGIEALKAIAGALPPDFTVPICVVVHTAPHAPAVLDAILSRAGALPAESAIDQQRLKPGRIYVAPPDRHLILEPGRARVSKGPRENRFRPAIDPLFRSAAQVYGTGAIGVILSGSLDDGTGGLWAIKNLGGCAVVQDPFDAMYPSMAQSAIDHVSVDYVVRLAEIAPLLVRLVAAPVSKPPDTPAPEELDMEVKIAMENNPIDAGLERLGTPSRFACPECHGVLLELKEGQRTKYRCHTGHAYSIASLLAAIGEGIEDALWNAVRALEEGHLLMARMADHVRTSHDSESARELAGRADKASQQADQLRRLVMERLPTPEPAKP